MRPIQTPITGADSDTDASPPERALHGFYAALNGRDLDAMARHWLDDDEASMDNPLGGIKRGWQEIREVYRAIFDGPARVRVAFHDYTLHVGADIFFAVGRERGTLQRDDVELALAIRTTRVFRRVDDGWQQLHHHGSIDDPELLRRYQDAIRRA